LLGFRPDVQACYQAFDVLVCPSRFEPLPRVVLEAMDAGTPVIASTATVAASWWEDYGGEVFPIGDEKTLANFLSEHAAHPRPRTDINLTAHHAQVANKAMLTRHGSLLAEAACRMVHGAWCMVHGAWCMVQSGSARCP